GPLAHALFVLSYFASWLRGTPFTLLPAARLRYRNECPRPDRPRRAVRTNALSPRPRHPARFLSHFPASYRRSYVIPFLHWSWPIVGLKPRYSACVPAAPPAACPAPRFPCPVAERPPP